jgi:nickel-type superoxide dismutase maturation protease
MPGPAGRAPTREAIALSPGLSAVLVEGPSMLPALRPGDCLLVGRPRRLRTGDVVVARFPSRPDLLVVKRAVRPQDGLWWVEGDNPAVTDDSRRYGPAEVLGRVLLRYWPPPLGRLPPSRRLA